MQYTSLVIEKNLSFDSMKLMVRAHHSREIRTFVDMMFEVYLDGNVSSERVEALARQASANCFVENTLEKVIPLTTDVYLNGGKVVTLSRKPGETLAG